MLRPKAVFSQMNVTLAARLTGPCHAQTYLSPGSIYARVLGAYTTDQSGQTWREPVLDLMFKPDVILAALAFGSTIFLGLLLLHHRT